jgi:hypothetical protein
MNPAEQMNREKKAAKLAAVLFNAHITPEELSEASPEDWEMAAEAAGCHPPHSQATIDLVVKMLAREYAAEADEKAEGKWLDQQMDETGAMRTPGRE